MNTLDEPVINDKPRNSGMFVALRIKLFMVGALFGAFSVLFVVLMQWHAPQRLGWTIDWLPSKSSVAQQINVTAPAIVLAPPYNTDHIAPTSLTPPAMQNTVPADIAPATMAPATIAPTQQTAAQSGALIIPVSGVSANQLTDTFKDARGAGRVHDAIDIMAPKGTPVLAVTDGKVVKLFNSKQGGLTIYQFDNSEVHAFYYAHLASYANGIVEGKSIRRGDLIGYVGNTGNASPEAPHLHFAIFVLGPEKNWWQGTAINPFTLLTNTTTLTE